ncbi:isopentenyl pyrophosphate isomerase [Staphylococcus gallinarum]|uniref:Isopentenyl pyrophosphate isomerase n=1 Tax=Staphylococcus gallinarum TaxID=1293 RepID=A0A380FN70_STAGA|nr:isopentenyl pyrophosphate isomerase [Staphylococcus gallinarum]
MNSPQEFSYARRETGYSLHGMENLAQIIQRVKVPVIVKEVGFGMSKEMIKALK